MSACRHCTQRLFRKIPNCGHESHLFGHGGVEAEARAEGIPFLGALPLAGVAQPAERYEPAISLLEPLTAREAEVLQLIAAGLSNREIAAQLHLSVNTVKMYASQLYRKLGASRRTEAVARAHELNLL